MNYLLTVTLKDGRVLTGQYHWLVAHARQENARTWPLCLSAELTEIK